MAYYEFNIARKSNTNGGRRRSSSTQYQTSTKGAMMLSFRGKVWLSILVLGVFILYIAFKSISYIVS